jgi:hypothetical protein
MTGATRSKGQVALSSMGQGSCLPLALAIEESGRYWRMPKLGHTDPLLRSLMLQNQLHFLVPYAV